MKIIDAEVVSNMFDDVGADICDDYIDGAIWGFSYKAVHDIIATAPTIDAEPVVHGHWNYKCPADGQSYRYCSECLEIIYDCNPPVPRNYCPNCGAKMDGGNNSTPKKPNFANHDGSHDYD